MGRERFSGSDLTSGCSRSGLGSGGQCNVRGGDYRTVGSKALSAVRKQKKDIGWGNWEKMRDERQDNAILTLNRRDVLVVVRRVEAVDDRRMPVASGHEVDNVP